MARKTSENHVLEIVQKEECGRENERKWEEKEGKKTSTAFSRINHRFTASFHVSESDLKPISPRVHGDSL